MIKTITISLACVLFLCGCSLFKVASTKNETFGFERQWAVSTLIEEHTGGAVSNKASPVIDGDILYQNNSVDGLVAVDATSGQILWRKKIEYGSESTPVIKDGVLFVGANDGQFYALEKETGALKWTFPTRTESLGSPVISGNLVIFLASNNVVYALDKDSGQQKWTYLRRELFNITVRGASKPALYKGNAILGFSDGVVAALRVSDGKLIWERTLNLKKRFKDIDSPIVIEGNQAFATGFDDQVYCFNPESGDLIWTIDAGGVHAVTLTDSLLFFATTDGRIIGANKNSGKIQWEYPLASGIATKPLLYKDILVVGDSEHGLIALLADSGRAIGKYHTGRGVIAVPASQSEKSSIFALTQEGNLYKFKLSWLSKQEALPWD
jgi:outer membrane protein assembly factor BamB